MQVVTTCHTITALSSLTLWMVGDGPFMASGTAGAAKSLEEAEKPPESAARFPAISAWYNSCRERKEEPRIGANGPPVVGEWLVHGWS